MKKVVFGVGVFFDWQAKQKIENPRKSMMRIGWNVKKIIVLPAKKSEEQDKRRKRNEFFWFFAVNKCLGQAKNI